MINLENIQNLAESAIFSDDCKNADLQKLNELKAKLGDDSLEFRNHFSSHGIFTDALQSFTDALQSV